MAVDADIFYAHVVVAGLAIRFFLLLRMVARKPGSAITQRFGRVAAVEDDVKVAMRAFRVGSQALPG